MHLTTSAISKSRKKILQPKDLPVVNPKDEPTSLMSIIFKVRSKPAEELSTYKVVMCPHCGNIQVTRGEKSMRCRRCGRASVFRKKGKWAVKLVDFPSFELAQIYAKRWAEKERK